MRNKFVSFVILSLALNFATGARAHAQNKVAILVSLTPAGHFTATSSTLSGSLVKTGSAFAASRLTVSIQSFKTGISLRDEHFHKHFSSKYPLAVLSNLRGSAGKATANLQVNGVTKPVSMTYQDKGNHVESEMQLKASEFNLPPAKYLGVGVRDEVKVEITMPYQVKK